MKDDVAGLVERLDGWADDLSCGEAGHGADQDVREAASTIRALVAKNERLKAKAEIAEGVGNELYRGAMDKLREAVEVLRRARENMEGWASYASDYFREKHDLAGDLAEIDAFLATMEKPND